MWQAPNMFLLLKKYIIPILLRVMGCADIDTYNGTSDKIIATLVIIYVGELRSHLC